MKGTNKKIQDKKTLTIMFIYFKNISLFFKHFYFWFQYHACVAELYGRTPLTKSFIISFLVWSWKPTFIIIMFLRKIDKLPNFIDLYHSIMSWYLKGPHITHEFDTLTCHLPKVIRFKSNENIQMCYEYKCEWIIFMETVLFNIITFLDIYLFVMY